MGFIINMIKADKNNQRVDKVNIKAFDKIELANQKKNEQKQLMEQSLDKLANRKRGILTTSIKNFIDVYEKIMKINFEEGEGIKELTKDIKTVAEIKDMKNYISTITGNKLTTNQEIATYFLKGGISGIIKKESEMNLSVANMRRRQAQMLEAQTNTFVIISEAVIKRADKISDILAKLNLLFMKSIKYTSEIIDKKGWDRKNYTKQDKEALMNCINFASAIKNIIDSRLFDENGEIAEESEKAINIGNDYLNKINSIN